MKIFCLFKVNWCPENGIKKENSTRYLKKLGDKFYSNVLKLVQKNQETLKQKSIENILNDYEKSLYNEVHSHLSLCKKIMSIYESRNEYESIVRNKKN